MILEEVDMRRRVFASLLVPLVLLSAILACNAPTWEVAQPELVLPTPAPTSAPEGDGGGFALPTSPASLYPQTFQAAGIKTCFAASSEASCQMAAALVLSVRGDGTAELSSTGPSIIDHDNCVAGSSDETWYANGTVSEGDQTVIFSSCNFGGFSASGEMSFSADQLSGEVSCLTKDNKKSVTLSAGR